ncbi:MAG: hypothetical protein EAZ78_19590 [Oscillatoriales cyanobacterium]|nr:MAG: hypothetical protein EAZ96_25205 [Oscillatoriales cyanobacterium]TAF00820.1 MAG: hypothetical protein EAZ78_19590 [Oscillatoriales cyanobacterium]TAF45872.1 MAG: hypothetical protein EAZ68_04510 [Oscillatoriales cyanobacterium]TAF70257.1 MAG: hypothetical protein EAZ59_05395 [Oscillatoriales cyanobacterium]
MINWIHNLHADVTFYHIFLSFIPGFCRGGAPVPAPSTDDGIGVSNIGATTGGLPLQRMKQPWGDRG